MIHICHRHNNIFFMNSCLGIEMSFWIWSVSGNQRTKSNKSTQTSSPPHSDFPSPHNVVSGFPPLSSKTSHAFSISQSLVFCTLHHLFQIYYHSVSFSAQCVRSKEHKDERITIRGGPDAGTILSNHFCMKYFYISNNTVGLGMSLFKTDTHPSSFYILLSASANCEKDYYTFFPQNFYIKKTDLVFI